MKTDGDNPTASLARVTPPQPRRHTMPLATWHVCDLLWVVRDPACTSNGCYRYVARIERTRVDYDECGESTHAAIVEARGPLDAGCVLRIVCLGRRERAK